MNFTGNLADVPLNPADYHPGLGDAFMGPARPVTDDLNGLERTMRSIGLSQPLPRAVILGGATSAVIATLQPGFAFDEHGPREFGFGDGILQEDGTNPTLFTWWSTGVLVGLVSLVIT